MKQSESALVKSCLDFLAYKKIFSYRNNTGGFKTESGHFYRYGLVGSPDIVCIINGQYVGIECKAGKKSKLSEAQFEFSRKLVEAGGQYWIVRSIEDLETELKNL